MMRVLRTTVTAVTVGVAAVLMAGCTADGYGTGRSTDGATATATTAAERPTDAGDRFAVLQRAFAATDAFPEGATALPAEMVPNSQRLIVTSDGTSYWIAAQKHGGACLVALNADPDSADNYSVCGDHHIPKAAVITSMLSEDDRETSLVSDGFVDHGTDALHELAPNIWIR